jgi:hypothetical protein
MPETLHIFVNKKKYDTAASHLKGADILQLAGLAAADYDLFLVKGDGKSDRINADQDVEIRNGLHFNAIAKGVNFGSGA